MRNKLGDLALLVGALILIAFGVLLVFVFFIILLVALLQLK